MSVYICIYVYINISYVHNFYIFYNKIYHPWSNWDLESDKRLITFEAIEIWSQTVVSKGRTALCPIRCLVTSTVFTFWMSLASLFLQEEMTISLDITKCPQGGKITSNENHCVINVIYSYDCVLLCIIFHYSNERTSELGNQNLHTIVDGWFTPVTIFD